MTDVAQVRRLVRDAVTTAVGPPGGSPTAAQGGTAAVPKVLLLSCIDYRYPRLILEAADAEGFAGHYYHMALAGASLAANTPGFGRETFETHLDFVVCNAGVTGVVILDHMDCAAYRKPLPAVGPGKKPGEVTCPVNPATDNFDRYDFATEYRLHDQHLKDAVAWIVQRHPQLRGHVTALLMPAELGNERVTSA